MHDIVGNRDMIKVIIYLNDLHSHVYTSEKEITKLR